MPFEIEKIGERMAKTNSTFLESFPIKSCKDLTYNEFFHEFMLQNKPCLIRDLMDDWEATKLLSNAQWVFWFKNRHFGGLAMSKFSNFR